MTDVGKISLGVELDASDLSAKLGEAVRRAIAPALAEIQRELNAVQREYEQTSRSAEKSGSAQAAAAKIAADAVHNVGEETDKVAAKTRVASGVSARSINAVTRAWEKQTAAIAANTAARAANAATPTGGGPGGGSGGGSGGGGPPRRGGPGDIHRGGFLQGGRGRFGFLTSGPGLNLMALGIGSFPAAATAVTNLTASIEQLAGAGLALPGIYGAAAASIGTAVLGFHGMGDAVKALTEAMKSGDPKDFEKATEAMKDMDPAAQAVAKTVAGLVRGPLLDLQKMVAGRMFAGFDTDLQQTADKVIPRLSGRLGELGTAWNGTLKAITSSMRDNRNLNLLDGILGDTATAQTKINQKVIAPLTHALLVLTKGGTGVLPRLADGLAAGAERFDRFITHAAETGQLAKWINDGVTGMHQLAESALNILKVIHNLDQAATGGGFLPWLQKATGQLAALTGSASGQSALTQFFKDGREQMEQWGPILLDLGKVLLDIYKASHMWAEILLPFLHTALDLLTKFPGLITAAGVALLAWKTSTIFKPLIAGLDSAIGRFGQLEAAAVNAGTAVAGGAGGSRRQRIAGGARAGLGALGSTKGLLGLGFMAGGTMEQLNADSTGDKVIGALSTVGGSALTGAAIGSVIPGVGTAIGAAGGAAVGAALAGVNFLLGENAQKSREAAAAQAEYQASLQQSAAALAGLQQAQKDVNDSLLTSKGDLTDAGVQGAIAQNLGALPDSIKSHYGEQTAKGFSESLGRLGLSNAELAQQITGAQPQFDALETNLRMMGPDGAFAAQQLQQMRDQILGMQGAAQTAAPAMDQLAQALHLPGAADAVAAVKTAVESIPKDVPITMDMPNAPAVVDILRGMGEQIDIVDGKPIVLNPDDAKVKEADAALEALGVKITHLPDGSIKVSIDPLALQRAQMDMNSFFAQYTNMILHPEIQPHMDTSQPPPGPIPGGPPLPPALGGWDTGGHASGGVFPGYAPGRDSLWARVSPGEGVLIPEAVRGLGGSAGVYAINSMFRSNLSRRGYANGGIVGFDDGGVQTHLDPNFLGPGPGNASEPNYAKGIYDILSGRELAPMGPLTKLTSDQMKYMADQRVAKLPGMSGGGIGPFGTPIKPKNRAYDAMAGALQALGFKPEEIIGENPVDYFEKAFTDQMQAQQQAMTSAGQGGALGAGGMSPANAGQIAAALVAFSHSGNLADVSSIGLNANSPVITAITSARNKKGGLADDQIAELIQQIIGGPGYQGVLDTQNSSIVKSLQSFHDQMVKKGGVPGAAPGMGGLPGAAGAGGLNFDALMKLEAGSSGGWQANTGNGYFGGLQFDQGTWDQYKLPGFPARADQATREQQIQAAMNALGQGRTPQSLWPANYSALQQPGATNVTGGLPGAGQTPFPAVAGGVPSGMTADAMGLITFAQRASGGAYKWGASDLAAGLSDCSGAVSDLVELITKGQATPERLFDTHSAGGVLAGLGAVQGAVPGMLQIGWSDEHMRATLPNGVNFESGGATGQGATYGGNAKGAAGMPNIMSLPVTGGAAGMYGAGGMGGLGGAGGVVPVYVTNFGQGANMAPLFKPLADGLAAGGQEAAGNVIGDLGAGISSAIQTPADQRKPNAQLADLVAEHNPMALAAALGINVQDFTRQGGAGPDAVTQAGGYDASGRLFSDTAGLIDRTFTSLNAQLDAMKQQLTDAVQQVAAKLNDEAVTPIIKAGVQEALGDLKDSVLNGLGTSIGQAAAPPIADAVKSAVASLPVNSSGAASTGGTIGSQAAAPFNTALGGLFAGGGAVWGGIPGKDSVPILAQQGEFVLDRGDVARMGGVHGVEAFRRAMEKRGGIRHFATGGGVNVNDVVGAEFFGVSEVPIIGTIVNLLVRVLLKMIGVDIEARDTMMEMSDDFRTFRGDAFKAFDAQGRLLNDTSGLIERSSTSTETAAAERIRILKIVIQAIIKYLIEKVIVPIAKAVANSVIQAGASAAGAAVSGAGGGPAGGIVSSVISSAGQAGVDIAAEVGTDFALAMSQTIIDMVAEGLMSQFGDQMTGLFGGAGLAALFDPAGGLLATLLGGVLGIFSGLLGGTLGGASTMIPGDTLFGALPFDNGGMAEGIGYLPKATNEPELVLSPVETNLFSRFVSALERGGFGSGGNRTVNAPITVIGGRETPEKVQNRLLSLMP
ncbi:tail length tape measure protein [Mycobacterium phage CRB2]|uniref:Tape measure protein n=1 Tax=Mycobacterium phage CRB2 TaxID=2483623 RepID=A0A455LM02_9CAUD|nr:tail length tape measure protein [Mycobacterium phage CRB2]AYP70016.1 tape measure protein [Mycobacterium phage CRB2]